MIADTVSAQVPVSGPATTCPTDTGRADRLSGKQLILLLALVADPDIRSATKAAGVSRATAFRWLAQPAFRDELTRRRDEVLSRALADIKAHATRAVEALSQLLNTADDRLRRQVCNDILDRAIKVRELEDFERRLIALEKAMESTTNRRQR